MDAVLHPPLQLIWIWGGIPGITWGLESSISCSNIQKCFLLPWLCIITVVGARIAIRDHSTSAAHKPQKENVF